MIDVALDRVPFSEASASVLDCLEKGSLYSGYVAWHSLSNFYYLVTARKNRSLARGFIGELLRFVQVAPVQTQHAIESLRLDLTDFEDALQVVSAKACQARFIVTRNIKHDKKSPIPAILPAKFLCV